MPALPSLCGSRCVSRAQEKAKRRTEQLQRESDFLRIRRVRLGINDFDIIRTIGRGAFGEARRGRARVPPALVLLTAWFASRGGDSFFFFFFFRCACAKRRTLESCMR